MAEKLMKEADSATSGRASLTLARGDEMTVVLVSMKAGVTLEDIHPPLLLPLLHLAATSYYNKD